ncbi:MAG TPA: hypothetical protein VL832_18340 [Puia sp.]|jgi:hypothetical protein|nr:hypothetical protein [Puia sp.]
MKKIDIEFDFRGRHYDAIIRIRQKPGGREFFITILDWELERLLYGNQVIKEADGSLQANVLLENKDQTELKLTIAGQLSKHMKMRCFTGDVCVSPLPGEEGWEEWHPIPRHLPGARYK